MKRRSFLFCFTLAALEDRNKRVTERSKVNVEEYRENFPEVPVKRWDTCSDERIVRECR